MTMERLPQLPSFSFPTTANQFDVEVTRIQSCTYRSMASQYVNAISIQANADICIEQIRQHAEETRQLIASTEAVMLRTLDLYRGNGAPSIMQTEVKTKLSGLFGTGLFGRSCKISVKTRCLPNYYLREPVR